MRSDQLSVISYQGEGDRKQKNRSKCFLSSLCSLLFLVFFVLPLPFIQGCQASTISNGRQVQVMRVVSGQTLEAITADKQQQLNSSSPHPSSLTPHPFKVRLAGIEAPDMQQQPWGQAAKQQLETMVSGKTATLELDGQDTDKFGRQWAYVWQNGKLLNEQLLKEGYVLWDGRSRDRKYDDRLEKAQAWARIMGRGVWNVKQPMRQTPEEFRHSDGNG